MRFALSLGLSALLLAGCVSAPNNPNQILQTSKSPEDYAQCVFPRVQKDKPAATLTGSQNHFRIVMGSKIAADDVIEIHKSSEGSKVSLYERAPLTSPFGTSLEKAARKCL